MIQLQWLQALLLVLGLIVSSVVVIAAWIKTSKEQRKQDIETWQSAVDALKEHNAALKDRLSDAELLQAEQGNEVSVLKGQVIAFEKERHSWTKRNMQLYDTCQDYRAQLVRLGQDPGEVPGGNGGR
jgi:hypothetical protein